MIKEAIVVEGRDDEAAVKAALKAEVIITNGLGISEKTIERIKNAQERTGVIIFTDPDYPGDKIRRIISDRVPGCKHAYLPRKHSKKDGDIGIENAKPEHIRQALSKVKSQGVESKIFTTDHMIDGGLLMGPGARERREMMGEILGLGYGNGKQFLKRLNHYNISMEEFLEALQRVEGSNL